MRISDILASIDGGTMALPEFQRGYVWSRDQVRGLMQSLYRQYPVGTLLVWKTQSDTTELRGDQPPFGNTVQLLLDGQQRITSLYGVMRGEAPKFFQGNASAFKDLYFDLRTETFEFYGPVKMKADPLWLSVTHIFQLGFKFNARLSELEHVTAEDRELYFERVSRLLAIPNIDLHLEEIIGPDKTVDVVVEIFNRVNSGGTKLSKGDLTLARICARWPQARDQMNGSLDIWSDAGFQFKLDWMLRVTNGVLTGKADFAALDDVETGVFRDGLKRTRDAVDKLLNLAGSRLGLDHDQVLTGRYAFPVMARFLDAHERGPLAQVEQQRLLFWYVHCFLWGRHSNSTESTLQQDLDALERGGLSALIDLLELWRGDLRVRPEHFAVAERGARFYPLLYMLTRVGSARDLHTGVELKRGLLGRLARLEIHHIFPKALMTANGYQRAERNSLANFCFLTQESNLAISARRPEEYLAECMSAHPGVLASQWIPEDPELWKIENYGKFLERRRELLANAANSFLDSLRIGSGETTEEVAGSGPVVVLGGDEQLVDEVIQIVQGVGLASPELDYEIVDDLTGEVLAAADAAWPQGLQEQLSEPVAFLVERDEDTETRLGALGYRFFSTVPAFRHYVEELTATDIDGDGYVGAPPETGVPSGVDSAVWQLVVQDSPVEMLQFHETYLRRCVDELGLDLRLPRTGDPRYVNVFPHGRTWGRVAALRPKSGRNAILIEPGAAMGVEHAEVVYSNDTPKYLRVYLKSSAAVDDAIYLTRLALSGQ